MRICIVLGTRPEIIKMSPIIRLCSKLNLEHFVVHTGQHYSYGMDKVFFEELELPNPKYNLEVGSGSHGFQTARIIEGVELVFLSERPDIVMVEGDTNTVLASALAASKLHLKVGHVEAGLRSYDREMPEEVNRVLVDHISDFLFCPTEKTAGIARSEGISKNKIFVTGNTIVDAVQQNIVLARKKSDVMNRFGLSEGSYMLATIHREENVDNKTRMMNVLVGLDMVAVQYNLQVVFPVHPRTRKMVEQFKLKVPKTIMLMEPLGYFDFLMLESGAKLILTDSGGLQEEACILQVPCVTLRENTERPETVEVGSNIIAGTAPAQILSSAEKMVGKKGWSNPLGDGKTSQKIIEIVCREL
ncbi:MAG: UDP-N-acetylglucosamine 2-epimerase (non-hydrolyzing) [Candidatus Woesearchaeota archaeon]